MRNRHGAMTGLGEIEERMRVADVPEPCPYLPNRVATLRFGNGFAAGPHYRALLDAGYRRNGFYVYRPACKGCDACQILRVPVARFQPSRGQRRVWRRGQRIFDHRIETPEATPSKLEVFRRYLAHQHGDPAPDMTLERYHAFLAASCLGGNTFELQLWAGDRFAGAGIADRLGDALSSVYFYFDPCFARYSPGVYSALLEIELARAGGLAHYYLGHYIEDCPSMNYKARFRPCEIRRPGEEGWRTLPA